MLTADDVETAVVDDVAGGDDASMDVQLMDLTVAQQ
jgi:hypothetical protein